MFVATGRLNGPYSRVRPFQPLHRYVDRQDTDLGAGRRSRLRSERLRRHLDKAPTTALRRVWTSRSTTSLVTDVRLGYFRYNIVTSKYNQSTCQFANQIGVSLGLNTGNCDFTSWRARRSALTDVGRFWWATQPGYQQLGSAVRHRSEHQSLQLPIGAEREDQFQVANNWTKTIGNHSIKFGADLRYARNLRVPSDTRTGLASLNFGTGPDLATALQVLTTGLGFATFLTGSM